MLEKLSIHHDLWIRNLLNLECELSVAEDIVQDMYIKLYEKIDNPADIMYGDEVNKYFIYKTLRNMYFNYIKRSNRYKMLEFIDRGQADVDDYDYGVDEAEDSIIDRVIELTSKFNAYDRRLVELFFGIRFRNYGYDISSGETFRAVSEGTGISTGSIFYSIKGIKRILRDEFGEDAQDYFNGDYDKI